MKLNAISFVGLIILFSLNGAGQANELRPCNYDRNQNRNWFYWCDFAQADLRNRDLSSTNFKGSSFRNTRLDHARLAESDLTGADVTGADFTGADLSNAVLIDVNLAAANLTGAKLGGAIVTCYQVCAESSVGKCILPPQQGADEEILLQLALDYPDFRTLTKNMNSNDSRPPLIVLKNQFVPQNARLTHVGIPVELRTEQELQHNNTPNFLEITDVKISSNKAILKYGYPRGADLGTFHFKKVNDRWLIEKRDALRSSSYGRKRLEKFRAGQ